jgi:hypothetical protein
MHLAVSGKEPYQPARHTPRGRTGAQKRPSAAKILRKFLSETSRKGIAAAWTEPQQLELAPTAVPGYKMRAVQQVLPTEAG